MNYQRLYEYRFRGIDQGHREGVWREIAPWVHRRMGRPERVLDPAAGRCEFINAIAASERWAVDMVAYDEQHAAPGVKVVVSDVMSADLPANYFDGIWISNFLEHLADQEAVAGFLGKMLECSRPGGRIAVMGPNFRYCADEYFDCADHNVVLTHVGVEEHLYAAGFEPVTVTPRFLPYSFRGRLPSGPSLTRAYLQRPWAWRVLGKQFLVIARRP